MKNSNLKRFMASLLAVVMIFSVVGISPAVFADDAIAPVLKENAGTVQVLIKDGTDVRDALAKALLANYDELTAEEIAAIDWQYYCKATLGLLDVPKSDAWGTIDGFKRGARAYKALADQNDDKSFQIRIGSDGEERTIKKVSKYDTELKLKSDVSIAYNMNADEMIKDIIANVVDMNASTLPAGVTAADFTVKKVLREGGWTESDFADKDGRPKDDAGDTPMIRVKYSGNDTYKACEKDVEITIVKTTVKVSVNLVNKIYAGEEIDRSTVYTLDPNDPEIDVYMFFVGLNSNGESCVYLKLNKDQENVIDKISEAQEWLFKLIKDEESLTLKEKLQEGITLGELKDIVRGVTENEKLMGFFETIGYDTTPITNLLAALDKLTFVADDTIVAIGTPAHAGVYTLTAIATGKNYETAEATGSLIVLKNWKGIELAKNPILNSGNNTTGKNNTITVSEAEALKAGNDLCILTKDGNPLNSASAGSINYWFTGVGKLYAKSAMPTAPGKYIVTASVRGGDFFALPKTFTFTIVADPTPEVTPEA